MPDFEITGTKEVLRRINLEASKIEGITEKGLIHAAIDIRRAMDKESPVIPVDTNNLRISFFIVTRKSVPRKGGGFKGEDAGNMSSQHSSVVGSCKAEVTAQAHPALIMGFTANYAVEVHESVNKSFNRKGAGSKFLQKHLERYETQLLNTIKKHAEK